jgi:hypothetical protein
LERAAFNADRFLSISVEHVLLTALAFSSLALGACASVSVIPVDYYGQPKNEAPGVRYYMPKPYLLVTQIPSDKTATGDTSSNDPNAKSATTNQPQATDKSKGQNGGNGQAGGGSDQGSGNQTPSSSPSSASDLSYQLGNSVYLVKLIYLPDMSKSMAINITPSVLGTSSVQPTLQDGWMLTSLQASTDNTKALDDFTSLATALVGGGAKGATGTTASTAKTASLNKNTTDTSPVLPPGLYEFRYDDEGHLIGLCAIDTFSQKSPIINPTNKCPPLDRLQSLHWTVRARG